MTNPLYGLFILASVFLMACSGEGGQTPVKEGLSPLAEIEARILKDPANPELFAERARYFEGLDSVVPALNDWRRAIALDSTKARYRIAMADLYFRKVRMDEAAALLEQAIRVEPANTEARLKMAEILLIRREYIPAMEQANAALRIDPQHAKGYFLKGWIHMEAGDTALAISSFRTSVERDPAFYKAYVQLGLIHAVKHDPLALDYYNSALEIMPGSVEAWYALGMFAQDHGMDSVALGCYEQIKQLDPKNPLPWYNTGYILLEHQRNASGAREQFAQAIMLDPLYAEAYYNRGLTYEQDGRLDSAVTDYQRALALDPDLELATDGLRRLGDRVTLPPR